MNEQEVFILKPSWSACDGYYPFNVLRKEMEGRRFTREEAELILALLARIDQDEVEGLFDLYLGFGGIQEVG